MEGGEISGNEALNTSGTDGWTHQIFNLGTAVWRNTTWSVDFDGNGVADSTGTAATGADVPIIINVPIKGTGEPAPVAGDLFQQKATVIKAVQ
jgi:hypothetical protein